MNLTDFFKGMQAGLVERNQEILKYCDKEISKLSKEVVKSNNADIIIGKMFAFDELARWIEKGNSNE